MILVTGGAYQGKTEYVINNFSLEREMIADGKKCTYEDAFGAVCICNFHILVKRIIDDNEDPLKFTEQLCLANPHAIIITDEIGCGIIPIEKSERIWRENAGRAGCIIAKNADTVIRIHCGLPSVIKGKMT